MIVSVAVLTIRKENANEVSTLLNDFVTREKGRPGVVKVYYKRAMNSEDTYLVHTEYEDRKALQASEAAAEKESKSVGFVLRPYLLKAFYGNFE
jgi:quinol monooxygenase YgiN